MKLIDLYYSTFDLHTYFTEGFSQSHAHVILLVAVCSWPSRSVTDKQNDKQKKRQTKKDKLGPVAPWGVDPRSPNFQGM